MNQLKPILYYLNPTKRYGPIYVPSSNLAYPVNTLTHNM